MSEMHERNALAGDRDGKTSVDGRTGIDLSTTRNLKLREPPSTPEVSVEMKTLNTNALSLLNKRCYRMAMGTVVCP